MRQLICFAIIVIVSFWGMVIMRENSRRSEGAELAHVAMTDAADKNATISVGENVKVEDHLADDRWTVLQFTADWCPACRQLTPQLEALTLAKQNVNLRRIDIRSWGSQVAKQFKIRRLPSLWLYEGKKRVATETREVLKRISRID